MKTGKIHSFYLMSRYRIMVDILQSLIQKLRMLRLKNNIAVMKMLLHICR